MRAETGQKALGALLTERLDRACDEIPDAEHSGDHGDEAEEVPTAR